MQTRGSAEGLNSTFIVDTTEDAGDVSGIIQAAMNRAQTLNAAAGSAIEGAAVVFPPGALAIDAPVIVGEGSDAASADILAQVGLDTTVATGVGSSLYVSTSATTDPVLPMTLSLPLPSSSGLAGLVSAVSKSLFLDTDTTKYAVAFVAEKKATGESFVGLIPNKDLTFKDGKAQFETSNWGSYRLIELAPEVEKPVERIIRTTDADVAPRRQNEVREQPKLLVTAREPFANRYGQDITITGENLEGMRAFIRDRRLTVTTSPGGASGVTSARVTLPGADELRATTGKPDGVFFVALSRDGSPGFDTNVFISASGTSPEFIARDSIDTPCVRQLICVPKPDRESPRVATVSADPGTGTFKAGQRILIRVDFNEPVIVDLGRGRPDIQLNTSPSRRALLESGSGTGRLVFAYAVAAGDSADDLDFSSTPAVTLNGATIRDLAGNDAILTLPLLGTSASIKIDTSTPAAPVIASIGGRTGSSVLFNAANPVITGTAPANSTVTIYYGRAELGGVAADGSGAWNFSGNLPAGTHAITARATNAAGTQGSASAAVALTIDTTPPASFQITGPVTPTTNRTPTVTWGAATDNSNPVTYVLQVATAATCGAGTVEQTYPATSGVLTGTTQTLTPALTDGTWFLCLTATDSAGNATVANYTFTINIGVPNAPVVSGPVAINLRKPTWEWTSGGGGAGYYRYRLDNDDLSAETESRDTRFTPGADLNEGQYTLYVQERNAARTWSATGSRTIKVDTTPPAILAVALTSPGGTGVSGAGTDLDFTVITSEPVTATNTPKLPFKIGDVDKEASYVAGASTQNNLVFRYRTAANDNGEVATVGVISFQNGEIKDPAGNALIPNFTNPATNRTIDTTAPATPTITSPAVQGYFNASIAATINNANTQLDANFKDLRYTLDGTTPTCASTNLINAQTGTVAIPRANTTLMVIACDSAGNASPVAVQEFKYDTIPPVAGSGGFSTPTSISSSGFTINWTAAVDSGGTVTANLKYLVCVAQQGTYLNTIALCESAGYAANSWTPGITSFPVTNKTASTTYNYNVIVQDEAGNKTMYTQGWVTTGAISITGSSAEMTSTSPERKVFYDSSTSQKHWAFWRDGSIVRYGYSSDGVSFTLSGSRSEISTARYSVTSKSGTVLIAYESGFDIMLMRGTITGTSNPTITWDTGSVLALDGTSATDAYTKPAITIGGDGSVYVAAFHYQGANGTYTPKAVRSTLAYYQTLAWSSPLRAGMVTSSGTGPTNLALVPQGSYAMAITNGADGSVHSFAFDGTNWLEQAGSVADLWNWASFGTVKALAVIGSDLYVGGTFTSIGGLTVNNIAKWNGTSLMWEALGTGSNGGVNALAAINNDLYVGGSFTTAGGITANRIAKWNTLNSTWSAFGGGTNSTVNAIAVSGTTVYVGGAFTVVGDTTRNYLAAINTDGTLNTAWSPNANNAVNAIAISGTTVYVGGSFTTIGCASGCSQIPLTTRNRLAAFDATTGTVSTWDPNASSTVNAITVSGSKVYVGGAFTSIGCASGCSQIPGMTRNRLAAIDTYGTLSTWNPNANGAVNAIAVYGSAVYVGGPFMTINNGTNAKYVAMCDSATDTCSSLGNGTTYPAYAISASSTGIYVAGSFGISQYVNSLVAKTTPTTGSASVTSDTGGVRLAYIDGVDSRAYYKTFTGSAWGTSNAVSTSALTGGTISLATSANGQQWLVSWQDNKQIVYRKYSNSTWGNVTPVTSGTAEHMFPALPESISTGIVPIIWTKGLGAPYELKAAAVSFP